MRKFDKEELAWISYVGAFAFAVVVGLIRTQAPYYPPYILLMYSGGALGMFIFAVLLYLHNQEVV